MSNIGKFVVDIETEAICRIVCWDEVDLVYVIKFVDGSGSKWHDMQYDGVKTSQIKELTDEQYKDIAIKYLGGL